MAEWLAAAAVLIVALWLMPTLVGGLKRRKRSAASVDFGGALLEIQKIVSPSTERLMQAQRQAAREETGKEEQSERT